MSYKNVEGYFTYWVEKERKGFFVAQKVRCQTKRRTVLNYGRHVLLLQATRSAENYNSQPSQGLSTLLLLPQNVIIIIGRQWGGKKLYSKIKVHLTLITGNDVPSKYLCMTFLNARTIDTNFIDKVLLYQRLATCDFKTEAWLFVKDKEVYQQASIIVQCLTLCGVLAEVPFRNGGSTL